MADETRFELRLTEAFRQLADLAPAMDDEAVARAAVAADRSRGRIGWLASLRRPVPGMVPVLVALALLLVAVLAAIVGGALRDDSRLPLGRNGVIAVTVQGNDHAPAVTHLVDAHGTTDRTIASERCPTYSTDGTVLAWLAYAGSASLVVAAADGTPFHSVPLVDDPTLAVSWALSADGSRVGWVKPASAASRGATGTTELWTAPTAGGAETRIVPATTTAGESNDSLVWSPDGARLAFVGVVADPATGERRRTAIYTVAADGSGLRRLTVRRGTLGDGMSWSPDGRNLAFVGRPDAPTASAGGAATLPEADTADVFVIAADGTGERNLTGTPLDESDPVWSPDGVSLAYLTSVDGTVQRATTVRIDDSSPVAAPRSGPVSSSVAWSPDSSELLLSEVETLGQETYRTTLSAIDPDFLGPPSTVLAVDGLIPCPPSWQRLAP